MDRTITEVLKDLTLLEKRRTELEKEIERIVNEAIDRAAASKPMNRPRENCFLIKCSELLGRPWVVYYHDWKLSAEVVKRFLESKSRVEWKIALQKKIDETREGKDVVFVFSTRGRFWRANERIPVSRDFIREIISQLD